MKRTWVIGLLLCVAAQAQEDIEIHRIRSGTLPIPIAMEGFTGEAASVVRFDLEVQGFEVTTPDKAQYRLVGGSESGLTVRVYDQVSGNALYARQYTGGTTRGQAHKLSDDFVASFPGRQGIASTRIAFRLERGRNSELCVADYDGFGAVAVTSDASIGRDPAWVPGRRVLYYTSYKSGNPFVYSHDLSSGIRKLVAGHPGLNSAPAVSPDGSRVAMILSRAGSPDLYVAQADGSGLTRLTTTKEDESSPCWSPDGRTICVVSRMTGRPSLYLIAAEGGTMRRLSTTGAINTTEPAWSPDGKTIAFTASMGGFKICTVPASGGNITELVAGEDPSWAPNSRTIIFTRRLGDRRVLSLLDAPTKRVKDVRQISGNCSQPDWAR